MEIKVTRKKTVIGIILSAFKELGGWRAMTEGKTEKEMREGVREIIKRQYGPEALVGKKFLIEEENFWKEGMPEFWG